MFGFGSALGLKNVFKEEREDVVSTEKAEGRAITFSKEQFNAGLRFPLLALFKEFLYFSKIPPAFIHPNIVRVLMGCSIINMLFNLDLTLLEVLFVYSLKKGKNDIFSMSAHLPSLQLVTELPDSTKGGAKGHVVVRGAWAGFLEHPGRPFSPNYSMELPDAKERHYATLLTARNLMAIVRESQEYVVNILPRKLPKEVVPGEHYVLKDLPIYQEVKEVDAEKREHSLMIGRREKMRELFGRLPDRNAAQPPLPRKPQQRRGSWPSISVVARLATLAEEAASINHPGSPHPDAHAAEALCAEASPIMATPITATPMEEIRAESQSLPSCEPDPLALVPVKGPPSKRSRSARNLRSGLIGRLRLQEIEVSCSSTQDAHPEEGGWGWQLRLQPSRWRSRMRMHLASPIRPKIPFSYAELEEKLKQIPPSSTTAMPSAKMFEMVETLVSGLRGMAQQHDLFTDLLRTTDYMKVFVSRHKNSEDQLRLRLAEAEASLSTAQGENEALRADLAEAKSREESMEARLHEAEMRWPG
ncbi:hypothetical protein CK203_033903 [Vitis vinifera]|uniref:Uncharacterized protein n=1 Tax=Vitis vinifera TaxID=29760 RepID=A0A438HUB5_VITVI|nr:hypothetical protein CK203_033903 [Vitis vinifera]